MIFDPLYLLIIGAGIVLSGGASLLVKSTFARYSRVPARSGLTGAQVAKQILQANGIHDVRVEPVAGHLSDHYDPRSKTLRLSEPVFGGRSLSAFGVAAHEVGHAIQHARGYPLLNFRSAWVPVANVGSGISIFVLIAAAFLGGAATVLGKSVALIGVGLFATTTVFTLITVPVEIDASRRALATLRETHLAGPDELAGARRVLNAAALTYVAAFITSLMTLLYWAYRLGLLGGRRN